MASLEGPRAKIDRAREHTALLDSEVRAFLQTNPYRSVHEVDANNGDDIWRVQVDREPPMRLSVIVGDVIHNLSSCLNHLVWQLALITTDRPYRRAEFPIYETRDSFEQQGCGKIRDVPYPAQKIIESIQPYHGDDERVWPFLQLKLIRELSNTDKHRIVLIPCPSVSAFSVPATSYTGLTTFGGRGPVLPGGMTLSPGMTDRYEIFRVPGDSGMSTEEKEKVHFALDLAVQTSETGKRCNMSAWDLMHMMCSTVSDYIIPEFERFFGTHGPGF